MGERQPLIRFRFAGPFKLQGGLNCFLYRLGFQEQITCFLTGGLQFFPSKVELSLQGVRVAFALQRPAPIILPLGNAECGIRIILAQLGIEAWVALLHEATDKPGCLHFG